jgi:tyrosyl-tRNA synthetase
MPHTLSVEAEHALLSAGAAEIVPAGGLREKLQRAREEGRPLRVKLGIDPTAPDIHLGFAVVLRKLRQFQDVGHIACLIVGDFTTMIGDPTGRSKARPVLERDEILAHARTYPRQLYRILDADRTEITFNSDWLAPMTFADVVRLASQYTVARILERDDFAQRLRDQQPVSVHELLYPLCQGYDSVAIQADVEIGGTDQKYNILVGRDLQREAGQEPQTALLMPLLVGTDGVEKMSKSLGNTIGIEEPPSEQFGKVMSIPDEAMPSYYALCTERSAEEVPDVERRLASGELHPMTAKLRLARQVVALYHGEEAAQDAEREFLRVFRQGELPQDMPDLAVPPDALRDGRLWIVRLLTLAGFAGSNSAARQLVAQGGVSLDGARIADADLDMVPRDGMVLRVGKRRFARLRLQRPALSTDDRRRDASPRTEAG